MRFKHKVVLITGASAGIGAAAARQFAAEGASLVLAARGREKLQTIATELGALAVVADIGVDADCERLVAEAVEAQGRIDVLVNNAGLHHRGPFMENEAADLAAMVHVNLRSPVLLSRMALEHMGRGSAIVNVASLAGRIPLPNSAVYSATKFGLRALSLALAVELEDRGVSVSAVSPGPVDTGFIMDDLEQVSDLTLSQPISRAEDVAAAVLACAHDGKRERALPVASGRLATVGYLAPGLRKVLEPFMERKGAKIRRRLLDGK